MNGTYDGTLPQILDLVGLKLKAMVASGDTDEETIQLIGDKVLGHTWRPTADEFVFTVTVNLSRKKRGTRTGRDLTVADIPNLLGFTFTRRNLLGFVMAQYDPMGLICPLLVILKIQLRKLYCTDSDLSWDDKIPDNQKS